MAVNSNSLKNLWHLRGLPNPMLGKKLTEEHKLKISKGMIGKNCWMKGKKLSEEIKNKISNALKGRVIHYQSAETRKKISEIQKGKKLSEKTKLNMSVSHKKRWAKIPRKPYIDRHDSQDYQNWRLLVYKRDNYICKTCGRANGKIHAHHIKGFIKYPELRYSVDNGITLCVSCHKKLHGRKNKSNKD